MTDLRHAYTTTTAWMVVLGLPGLALTTVFAPAFVPTVFGERYDSSTPVLIFLSVAYFSASAMGPSSLTLKALGRVRYTVGVDLFALAVGFVAIVGLVLVAGAAGAALGTLVAILVRAVILQVVLRRVLGAGVLGKNYVWLAAGAVVTLGVLGAVQAAFEPSLLVAVVLSGLAGLMVLVGARRMLDLESTFPELGRSRLAGLLRS